MPRVEILNVVFLHDRNYTFTSLDLGTQIGEYKQIARAKGITAKAIVLVAVNECHRAIGMPRGKDNLNLSVSKIEDLTVTKILTLAPRIGRYKRFVTLCKPYCLPFVYSHTCMIAMSMSEDKGDRLLHNILDNLSQSRNLRSCINKNCGSITFNKVDRLIIDEMPITMPCMLVEQTNLYVVILEDCLLLNWAKAKMPSRSDIAKSDNLFIVLNYLTTTFFPLMITNPFRGVEIRCPERVKIGDG